MSPIERRVAPIRGLRGRVTSSFALAAFAGAFTLALVTYASTRAYLLDQGTDTAARQAYNNAQLVRTILATDPESVGDLMTNIRTERGGFAVLHLEASDTFYAQEPLRFTQSNLPRELLDTVLSGATARQRFTFEEAPYEVVGVAIAAPRAQYFEAIPLASVRSTLATIATTLSFGVLFITVTAGILGFTMSRGVLGPLRRIASAVGEIASGGLDARLGDERDPDLAGLAASFNDMVDAVRSRIEREVRFASDVSHELRSPVTALVTAVEVLEARRDEFSERNRQALDILGRQVRRFDRTVRDLLELSRLDAGEPVEPRADRVETLRLGELVRRIAGARGFATVPVETTATDDLVGVDRARIERILVNLLENARDHAGGATVVRVADDAHWLRLEVEDAGAGVAASERERIFDRFARGTASRNSVGSGLGLAIVSQHARALGGDARVETAPGGGARFVVRLARTAMAPADREQVG
jgi:signal transduction histidine kinase